MFKLVIVRERVDAVILWITCSSSRSLMRVTPKKERKKPIQNFHQLEGNFFPKENRERGRNSFKKTPI